MFKDLLEFRLLQNQKGPVSRVVLSCAACSSSVPPYCAGWAVAVYAVGPVPGRSYVCIHLQIG